MHCELASGWYGALAEQIVTAFKVLLQRQEDDNGGRAAFAVGLQRSEQPSPADIGVLTKCGCTHRALAPDLQHWQTMSNLTQRTINKEYLARSWMLYDPNIRCTIAAPCLFQPDHDRCRICAGLHEEEGRPKNCWGKDR